MIEEARRALTEPGEGYFVARGFYSEAELARYRVECEALLQRGPRYHARLNTDSVFDYVHPWSFDSVERSYRLYQYLHNPHSGPTTALFERTLGLRDEIEHAWTADPTYRREVEALQSFVIATRYLAGTGRVQPHRDYLGRAPFPLLQSLALLSRPGLDFEGGELVLYPRRGAPVRAVEHLGLGLGDLLLFDKTLSHEVETTLPGRTGVSRWSMNIGARAPRQSYRAYLKMRLLQNDTVYPLWRSLTRRLGIRADSPSRSSKPPAYEG
jgi:hypothetical protein